MGEDVVRRTAGEFGRWQAGLCVLLSLLKLPIAWFQLNVLVLDAPVPFHCAGHDLPQPGVDACSIDNRNDTPTVQGNVSGAAGCGQWQYSKDVFTETIVTQVCFDHDIKEPAYLELFSTSEAEKRGSNKDQ